MSRDEVHEITYELILRETATAVLFEIEGEQVWIPRSVIGQRDDDAQSVEVAVWWLTETARGHRVHAMVARRQARGSVGSARQDPPFKPSCS